MTSGASTEQVVLAYLEAINAADPAAASALVADDFHNEHTSSLGHSLRGRAAYAERLPRFMAEFAGLHYDVEDVIVDDDRAAVPYTMTFTWTSPEGDEHPVSIRGMFRFRVSDGLIAHRVDYWDGTEFQRQTATATGAP